MLRFNINSSVGCLTRQRFIDWSPGSNILQRIEKIYESLEIQLKNLIKKIHTFPNRNRRESQGLLGSVELSSAVVGMVMH